MEEFRSLLPNPENMKINKIVPIGLADSNPMMQIYLTGKFQKDYNNDLKIQDNLFKQFLIEQKQLNLFIAKEYEPYLDEIYTNNFNERDVYDFYHSISKNFNEWFDTDFQSYKKSKRTLKGDLLISKDQASEFFKKSFKENLSKLNEKKKDLKKDLDDYFIKNENTFLYVPQIDNFSHYSTYFNKNYLKGASKILSNLFFMISYLNEYHPEVLLISLSDHGADETPYQQETFNHETPLNNYNNNSYFLLYNKFLNSHDFSDIDIKSSQVTSIISSLIRNINQIGGFDISYEFFQNKSQKIIYFKFFDLRLKQYLNDLNLDKNHYDKNISNFLTDNINYLKKNNKDFSE